MDEQSESQGEVESQEVAQTEEENQQENGTEESSNNVEGSGEEEESQTEAQENQQQENGTEEEEEQPAKPSEKAATSSSSATAAKKKSVVKFGTQVKKSPVILVFRNGDKHHKGVKMTLKAYKTIEQLHQDMNKQVGVATGAVRQIFTPDGKLVKKLDDFVDGEKYICAGAEKLNKELMPTAITQPEEEAPKTAPAASPVKKPAVKKPTVSAYAKGGVTKFGLQSEKAKVIYAFRNGDKHHGGAKITVHPTKFKTFEQLKEALTKEVQVPTGAVMKLFSPDGKQVKDFGELEDGGKYIACGAEALNKESMPTAIFEKEEKKEEPAVATPPKPVVKKPTVSAYAKGGVTKFGLQSEKSKSIFAFRNGDKHHGGVKITVHSTKFKNWEQLLAHMTKEVRVPTGPVMKVFSPDGTQIKGFDGLEDGGKYIACGAEKLNKELMPSAILDKEEEKEPEASAPAPVVEKKEKPTVTAYAKGGVTKFGTQSEKAKVIYVFRNGDKHHAGLKMTVHSTKFKNFDQLKEAMTKQIGVPTGAVRQVFAPDGKLIKTFDQLEDEGKYICAGAEKLNKDSMPVALKSATTAVAE